MGGRLLLMKTRGLVMAQFPGPGEYMAMNLVMMAI